MKYKVWLLSIITCGLFLNTSAQEISTVSEIYDYDIGDIFHRRSYENYDGVWFERLYGITIVDKYYEPDSSILYYDIEGERMERAYDSPDWEYSTYTHTSSITNLDSLINDGVIDSVSTNANLYNGRIINYYEHDNYPNTFNEWRYVNGCGRAHHYYHGYGFGSSISELLYYNKGGEEWGEPILLLNTPELEKFTRISIYPNPVEGDLNIQLINKEKVNVSVMTILGERVKSRQMYSMTTSIPVSDLIPGIYFLLLENKHETIVRKFVKK